MTAATQPEPQPQTPPRRRRRWLRVLAALFYLMLAATTVVYFNYVPHHRTALLVDASAAPGGFDPIRQAVHAVANNQGRADAFSLRRFGGECGDPANTEELVPSQVKAGSAISDGLRVVRPGGKPTLLAGILGAIEDFSPFYPFRGLSTNRILVVTRAAVDPCAPREIDLRKTIQDKVTEAGLDLEFRFVGYQVPAEQQAALTQLAAALGAPAPAFPGTVPELGLALRKIVLPPLVEGSRVTVPTRTGPTTPTKPVQQALIQARVALSQFQAVITADIPGSQPCTIPRGLSGTPCEFRAPAGSRVRLQVTLSGPRPHRGQPAWFGCLERSGVSQGIPTGSPTCTLDLSQSGFWVCLGTTDRADPGGALGCYEKFRRTPQAPIPFGATGPR